MRAFYELMLEVWRYSAGQRGKLITYVSMLIIANLLYLVEPYLVARVINGLQDVAVLNQPMTWIFVTLMGVVALTLLLWLFHGPARVMEMMMGYSVGNQLIDRLFNVLTALPMQWHRQHHSGNIMNRIRKASRALIDFTGYGFQSIEMVVRLMGSIIALYFILPVGAFLALIISTAAVYIVCYLSKFLIKRYEQINRHEHFVAEALHDYITNIFTVLSLRLETLSKTEVHRRLNHYRPLVLSTQIINEVQWFFVSCLISLQTVIVLGWYIYSSVSQNQLPHAGTLFMLYEYLQKIGAAFYVFASKYTTLVEQYADFCSIKPILAAERVGRDLGAHLPTNWRVLEIEQLSFTYEDPSSQVQHHLKNIKMQLKRHQRIALVGKSGSGKSTLMSLIRGLQTTDQAKILCDGVPLLHGLAHLAPHVTLIPQEPEIFSNTIEYNISVDTEVSHEELMRDVELAQFTSVLERLPHGLQTDIAEKGVNLSGGEKQRLALARGIFAAKSSDIILLDEPTSSVDSYHERLIYQNLFDHFSDRCIVSSIHKLHLLPLFDQIYLFEQGEIVELGGFDELIAKEGKLAALWLAYQESTRKDP